MDDYVRLGFFGLWVRFDNKKIDFKDIIARRIFVLKGNKGSTLFTLNIGGFSICFVNSHLSAHEDQSKRRVAVRFRVISCFYSEKLFTNLYISNEGTFKNIQSFYFTRKFTRKSV